MKQRTNTALLIHILFVKYLDFGIASTITVGKQSQNKYQVSSAKPWNSSS